MADPAPGRLDLARRIHDRVLQRLFVVSLVLEPDGPLAPDERARCRSEVERALAELRAALDPAAAPPRAEGESLVDLLALLREELGTVPLDVSPQAPELPADLEPLARHFVAETVRNAGKHAQPTRVEVRIALGDDGLAVDVENDGAACTPSDAQGIGLRLLSAEAELCGGSVEVGVDGERWRASLRLPPDRAGVARTPA